MMRTIPVYAREEEIVFLEFFILSFSKFLSAPLRKGKINAVFFKCIFICTIQKCFLKIWIKYILHEKYVGLYVLL